MMNIPPDEDESPIDEEYNKQGYQDSEDSDAPTGAAWNEE